MDHQAEGHGPRLRTADLMLILDFLTIDSKNKNIGIELTSRRSIPSGNALYLPSAHQSSVPQPVSHNYCYKLYSFIHSFYFYSIS